MTYDWSDDDAWMGLKVVEEATTMGGPPPGLASTCPPPNHPPVSVCPPPNHPPVCHQRPTSIPQKIATRTRQQITKSTLIATNNNQLQFLTDIKKFPPFAKPHHQVLPSQSSHHIRQREKVLVWFEPPSIIPGKFLLPILLPL